MKNTFGTNILLTIFGESHGTAIGAVLDGLPAGFLIDTKRLEADMDKRRPRGKTGTPRHETDQVEIVSGLFEGKTTGTPLTMLIYNTSTRSKDYDQLKDRLRPGHADFTAYAKYEGFQDYRGGGHFSGRITAALVAAGSICAQILEVFGVEIGTHLLQLHHLQDAPFANDPILLKQQIRQLAQLDFAVLDGEVAKAMQACIEEAASQKDSVGGILQSAVIGLPAGLGEPFFDSVESILAHLLFSIPGVKGVSFGEGFGFASLKGSVANDPFTLDELGNIQTITNHNGGINGGITNGMPLLLQTVMKPTPSIFQPQKSVHYSRKEEVELTIQGRHDPAIIHRARIVVDAILAFGLLDLWVSRLGIQALQHRDVFAS